MRGKIRHAPIAMPAKGREPVVRKLAMKTSGAIKPGPFFSWLS